MITIYKKGSYIDGIVLLLNHFDATTRASSKKF